MNRVTTQAKALTIFLDRALVERSFKVSLEPGETVLSLTGMGTGIIESSIKVQIPNKNVVLTASSLKTLTLWEYKEDAHKKTWAQARETLTKLMEILDQRLVFNLKDKILSELRDYVKESLNPVLLLQSVSITKVREALTFVEEQLSNNASRLLDLRLNNQDTQKQLAVLKAELKKITKLDRKIDTVVEIALKTDQAVTVEGQLSYVIGGVSWTPVYDADLDTEKKTVNFRSYGQVSQATTEVWENVQVSLSTASVDLSPLIPEIHPLSVSSIEQKRTRTIIMESQSIETLDEGGIEPAPEPEEPTVSRGLISALFPITRPVSLPSDGIGHRVPIYSGDIDSAVGYETVPAQIETVYLRGQFTNTSQFPFLPGKINIYRNGSYVGKSTIAYTPIGQSLVCSFGTDDDLRVQRIVMEDHYKAAEGLIGKNIYTQSLRFLLTNFKEMACSVSVKEGIFVSELKEVVVKVDDDTTTTAYELNKDGVMSWSAVVNPGSSVNQVINLKYTVESGKAFDLRGIL